MLREEMPRSLLYCYRNVTQALDGLADDYGERHACHATAAAIEAELAGSDMEAIFQSGLHEFVSGFIVHNNALSSEIAAAYNFP
jgi:uncharacterized alpha-E superfamily protein